jgi:hypothetical protein
MACCETSAYARSSEVASPTPNVTVTPPNTTASKVTSVRRGRADGAARPRVTARGSVLSRASARCARYPCAGRGARPAAQPKIPGRATISTYEATTWAGVKPRDFSTPILVVACAAA